jgi:hypothetical protein
MILMRVAGSQVSSVCFKGFWSRGMTGTKVPLKIIPTHRTTSARKAGDVLPADSPAPHKPKLLDQLREALHSRNYSGRIEQSYMIFTLMCSVFYTANIAVFGVLYRPR